MFKALYIHVNNITNLQPYPIIFTMGKKGKIKTKATIQPYS